MVEQPKLGGKGQEMEEALRAYFFAAGYFVLRGLPFQLDDEDVTDIDLWLYERPAAATRRRILVDIKNKRSPKAVERIIWVKGLQYALGVDAAVVATTDRRASSRRLAKALGITLLDGDAISKLTSKRLDDREILDSEQFDEAVKKVDLARHSTTWRDTVHRARSSIVSSMGIHSANQGLDAFRLFSLAAVEAYPGSAQAETAVRLAYLMAALALVSLDYVMAEHAFRMAEERKAIITNAIRYGMAELEPRIASVDTALGLLRSYVPNGGAVARQIANGFQADADRIPAEIIAEFITRASNGDAVFQIARELESEAVSVHLRGFDDLSGQAKGAIGAFLDFSETARANFAGAWPPIGKEEAGPKPVLEPGRPEQPLHVEPTTEQSSARPNSSSRGSPNSGPLFGGVGVAAEVGETHARQPKKRRGKGQGD